MRGNVFAVTALLFVALGVGGALPAGAKERPVVVGKGAVPVGLIRPSASLTAVEGATYVGSQSCRDCHSKEYTEWAASGHANMLRAVTPDIVKGDFADCEIAYEGVEVEAADKSKVKIAPKIKTETRDGKFFVTLLDADNSANNQSYEVVEVLGSLWEQQYYLKVGDKIFPSPVR